MLNWDERGHVVAVCDKESVYCRVIGLGNMNNCAPFQNFSLRMQAEGYRRFILDFSSCDGLDSTFLGILLGIAIGDRSMRPHVVILNPNKTVRRVLREVGIDHILKIREDSVSLPDVPMTRLQPEDQSSDDKMGMMLEAHENLCSVDGAGNLERFGAFLSLLRAELGQKQSPPGVQPQSASKATKGSGEVE